MDRRLAPLVVAAAAGPVVFTATWAVLGALRPGYSGSRSTISALAAVGAPHAGWMVAAFVVQGLCQVAGAALTWQRDGARWVAVPLATSGLGTVLAGLAPLPGPAGGTTGGAHSLGATLAFTGLHLAVVGGVCSPGLPRWLRLAGALALVVALPDLAWFLAHLGADGTWYGGSERTFVTVLLAWCVALALHRRPGGA